MMYKQEFVAVVKCNGSILRERGDVVYLPFGSTYSILLKNKSGARALVNIEVDGKDVLSGHGLILDANSSSEIKGFMRNMKETNKFKFIKKTREIQKHRGDRIDDGLIRISYRFEKAPDPLWYSYAPYVTCTNDSVGSYYSGQSTYKGFGEQHYSSSMSCCYTDRVMDTAPKADEGITVKGEKTYQRYEIGSMNALEATEHAIVLHLKGITERKYKVSVPLTVKAKCVCETCGRRSKSSAKFCFNCGTYLQ